ncbi:MAG TPA: TIGR03915 family putative DNA repair protein [Bacteroidales bacterium]|nr:TIGR03915 family putative DNA repair protein [Bacteroidales bacterium]
MTLLCFDDTFDGFLTLIFESYRLKIIPDKIIGKSEEQLFLFSRPVFIPAEAEKSDRVWNKIIERTSKDNADRIYRVFMSEVPGSRMLIYEFIRLMTERNYNIEADFTLRPVLEINKLHRKVAREADRIRMFTRFQKTAEKSYFAAFSPQYNVLPLVINHFTDRFSDQEWIIYDLKRNFGFYSDKKETSRISFTDLPVNPVNGQLYESFHDPEERSFQELWRKYYNSIKIEERSNYKLHRQMLPRRFWRYLTEKG